MFLILVSCREEEAKLAAEEEKKAAEAGTVDVKPAEDDIGAAEAEPHAPFQQTEEMADLPDSPHDTLDGIHFV